MTEHGYLRRYPYRIVIIHAGAWLRDKTLAVAALGGSSEGGSKETTSGGDLFEDHPVDEHGTTLEALRGGGPRPQVGAEARRTGAKLPPWFDRSRANRHVVTGLEDDAGRLLMMQWKLAGKEGMFQPPKRIRRVETYKELNLYNAVKAIGGALSGVAKGGATGW